MRWTLVSGDFVPTGGMDRGNLELARYLALTGDAVELVTHRADVALAALPGVMVRTVHRPFGSDFLGGWPLSRAGTGAGRETAEAGGRVLVNGGNCPHPDATWLHYVHAAYRPEVRTSWVRRLKARVEHPFDLRAERRTVRGARIAICNSERTRRDAIERLGADPGRTAVVYYGTDPERFRPADAVERTVLRSRLGWPADRPVLVFVGALGDRRKGFDTLFDAWTSLARTPDWDATLMVVGSGVERSLWERRVAEAAFGDRVRFLGFRSDVPDLLRAADAMVAPTRYEAYGLGVREALCCGIPAIVSAEAGVAEHYPPALADLLLADPESSAELADRLRHWCADLDGFAARVRPLSDSLRSRTWADMARDICTAILAAP